MKKILIALFLSLSLLAIIPLGASAAETTVKYFADGSYTVKIPEYLEANTDGKTLKISDVIIPFGCEITVSADYDGTLYLADEPSVTLPCKLFINENEYTNGTVLLRQSAGHPDGKVSAQLSAKVTEKPLYAGIYRSSVTFDIQVREVTETNYSAEDIANNAHLYAIGSTNPEYVVAQFNDDYSSVMITKNGADSDGKMRGWNARRSPFSEHKETLKNVAVKDGVVNISGAAFYECTNVLDVHLPDGITVIARDSFRGCSALQSIYLSDDIQKIEPYAFAYCMALKQVVLPKDLSEISDGVFSNCHNLTSVDIGEKVTKIGGFSFSSCIALQSIAFPPDLQSVEAWAFRYCDSLETVDLPESVHTLGAHAFSDCRKLRQIHLPARLTELPNALLYNCSSLAHIDIPKNVTKIDDWALSRCRSLTELYISENIVSIGRLSFNGLHSLPAFSVDENNPYFCAEDGILYSKDKTKLLYFPCAKNVLQYTVPETVTELGESCFDLCEHLTDIYIGNQVTVIDSGMFGNMKRPFVHTPKGSAMEQFCIDNNIAYDNIMQ